MIIVYTKEKEPKELFNTILTRTEVEQSGGLFIDHPELREEDCIVVETERPFENPISDDLVTIREMTREELILMKNKTELLLDGEYIETGEIKTVEKPLDLIRPIWNRELHVWSEGMTKEELMTERKNKILKYAELKKEIETLTEFSDEFESDNTVEMLKLQMQQLKKEINELLEVIKKM